MFEARSKSRKIAAIACYDYTTAKLVQDAGADMILMGDSAAQVILGYDSTLPATMDFIVTLTALFAAVHQMCALLLICHFCPITSVFTML